MNAGKAFEKNFKESAVRQGILCQRQYDVMSGYKGISYPYDFLIYKYPYIYFIELKSYERTLIPISAVTEYQVSGLTALDNYHGTRAGLLLNFREEKAEYAKAFYIPINLWTDYIKANKSIGIPQARIIGTPLDGEIKRVNWVYDISKLLGEI